MHHADTIASGLVAWELGRVAETVLDLVVDGGLMAGSYRMAQELLAGTPSTGL